jgi:hypothetical protein
MINRTDIIQGSEEWHEIRWAKIGGTSSEGLHKKSETLLIKILSERLEEFEPEEGFQNDAMQRGQDLETFAREFLEGYTGLKFIETGWIQSEENELLGMSPDGITEDLKSGCEIKCPSRKEHTNTLIENAIPLKHIAQILQAFIVNPDLESWWFISFRPESPKHFIECVTLDSEVNMGTKARPQIKTIREWREITIELADKLLKDIQEKEQQLFF